MDKTDINKEKRAIIMMILNAYINTQFWSFSLDNNELERYMEKLKKLFIDEGLTTILFLKDNNNEYSNYKNFLLELFNGELSSFGLYDERYNEVHVEKNLQELIEIFENNKDFNKDFIEIGSYYITDFFEVFESERIRTRQNLLQLKK